MSDIRRQTSDVAVKETQICMYLSPFSWLYFRVPKFRVESSLCLGVVQRRRSRSNRQAKQVMQVNFLYPSALILRRNGVSP